MHRPTSKKTAGASAEQTWPVGLFQRHISLEGFATSAVHLEKILRFKETRRKQHSTYLYKLIEERQTGVLRPPILTNFYIT